METISVSKLKTHLSAELKRVQTGLALVVVDHRRPVAVLSPIQSDTLFVKEASARFTYEALTPLVATDPVVLLDLERADSW